MTAPAATERVIDDEQLAALVGHADTVELKLSIPDEDRRSTVVALEIDPLDAQLRQVFFLDTPDLALNQAGVVARARRSQGRDDDSVVKLRPVVPGELDAKLGARSQFGVEVDAMPGGYVCSASFKGTVKAGRVKQAVAGERPLRKLFSKHQRAFFDAHAPAGIGLDDLTVLGPVTVMKLKYRPKGYGRKLVAELWLYPDGDRILELSTKCAPGDAHQVALDTRAFLEARGVNLEGEQQTKTRTALDYFSAQLSG